ncbi:MAG: low specificity L-threonine aldolase [Gemmatimonas sp.]|nr:low specificity L-threonine aldolase [Gemmatimonas sp.]
MIDLRSDTVTRPTAAMRRAMAEAEVGDDVLDGDPTVLALQERVASLLGKERALFVPTGTMGNACGLWVHGRHGTEAYAHDDSHIVNWEIAGLAGLRGLQPRMVRGAPVMTLETLRAAVRPASKHAPTASVVCFENTHNGAGGMVTPLAELRAMAGFARGTLKLPIHLDGARLWNAHIATGTSLADFAACADTVMVSFSKGLGAPLGACVAGSAAHIDEAFVARKRLGGGMRQSGIVAAAALHGLEHHLGRLAEDHANATRLAAIIADGVEDVQVVPPDTNIVMIDLPERLDAGTVTAHARELGVLISAWHDKRVRVVCHLDASAADVGTAAHALVQALR